MIRNIYKIFISLTKTEKYAAIGAAVVFLVTTITYGTILISRITVILPNYGGTYREGMVEQPVFINPILATSGADKDIINLIYSNLYDLSDNIKVANNKLVWNVHLKDNVLWHDGKKLSSDDVIFTIQSIHDRESRSPLSVSWGGITAERVSELEIKITTQAPYAFFEDNLKQLYVIPKHLFEDVPLANWRASEFNREPIGTGPYEYVSYKQEKSGFISSYSLKRNEDYFGKKPYIDNIEFLFFKNEDSAISAFNMAKIDGLGNVGQKNLSRITRFNSVHELHIPSYYAIFLNQGTNELLKNKNVRMALNYATPRNEIVNQVWNGHATIVSGPLPYVGIVTPEKNKAFEYNIEKAIQILDDTGIKADKDNTRGKITIVVPNIPFLVSTGEIIKQNWLKLGFAIETIVIDPNLVNNEVIKTRNYDAILFGNALAKNPDIISFWHTKERFYPGQNLSLYSNKTADSFLESIRQNFNEKERAENLASLQSIILEDMPAIFLYSPNYIMVTGTKVGGIDELIITNPGERLDNVEYWYVKTRRSFDVNQKPETDESESADQDKESESATSTPEN